MRKRAPTLLAEPVLPEGAAGVSLSAGEGEEGESHPAYDPFRWFGDEGPLGHVPHPEPQRALELSEASALMAAVERAIVVMEVRTRAIREGRVAPPRPRPVLPADPSTASAPAHATPPSVLESAVAAAREAAAAADENLDAIWEEPGQTALRHDTVVMDADAIRAFVSPEAPSVGGAEVREHPQVEAEPALPEGPSLPPPPPVSSPTTPMGRVYPAPPEPTDDVYQPRWSRDIELLYDDALYLFQNDDAEGALISLERLLIIAPMSEDIQQFIVLNEPKLVSIYERVIGPWDKMPRRRAGRTMPPAYTRDPKLAKILGLIDGMTPMVDVFNRVAMSRLEVCSVLSQLLRSRLITTEQELPS